MESLLNEPDKLCLTKRTLQYLQTYFDNLFWWLSYDVLSHHKISICPLYVYSRLLFFQYYATNFDGFIKKILKWAFILFLSVIIKVAASES